MEIKELLTYIYLIVGGVIFCLFNGPIARFFVSYKQPHPPKNRDINFVRLMYVLIGLTMIVFAGTNLFQR